MDHKLWKVLKEGGISDTINEDISTVETFASLEKEHLNKLVPKLTVGQHPLLMMLWRSHSSKLQNNNFCTFDIYQLCHLSNLLVSCRLTVM